MNNIVQVAQTQQQNNQLVQSQQGGQQVAVYTEMMRSGVEEFKKVLPAHIVPERFIRIAESAINRDETLRNMARANPGSLMVAMLECARLGHYVGDRFYLVPKGGKTGIVGWESWKGMAERIMRTGRFQKVVVETVNEGEKFEFDPNRDERPNHEIDWATHESGKTVLSYAYAVDNEGRASKVAVITPTQVVKAKALSRGDVWSKWDAQMWRKSAIRQLVNYVDVSVDDLRGAN